MNKKLLALVLAAVMLCTLFAACAKTNEPGTTTTEQEKTETTTITWMPPRIS